MAQAEFSEDGVTLHLSKEEWWFVVSSMTHVLYGRRLSDNDLQNILMTSPADAERLVGQLCEAEVEARRSGSHWAPRPDL